MYEINFAIFGKKCYDMSSYVNNGTVIIFMIDSAENIVSAEIASSSSNDFVTRTTSRTTTGANVNEVTMHANLVRLLHNESSSGTRASPIFFRNASFHACSLIIYNFLCELE